MPLPRDPRAKPLDTIRAASCVWSEGRALHLLFEQATIREAEILRLNRRLALLERRLHDARTDRDAAERQVHAFEDAGQPTPEPGPPPDQWFVHVEGLVAGVYEAGYIVPPHMGTRWWVYTPDQWRAAPRPSRGMVDPHTGRVAWGWLVEDGVWVFAPARVDDIGRPLAQGTP